MRQGTTVYVSPTDRRRLEAIVADRNSPQKHVWRAKIALAAADGHGTAAVGRRASLSPPSVRRWREWFAQEGVAGLLRDKTRKPGTPPLPPAVVERVVELTLGEPPGEATHWTGRAMAKATGISLRSVQRIWAAHRLAPHRVRSFKLSRDPTFVPKLRDVVGLYLHPPAHAIVLSVDEKSCVDGPRPARGMSSVWCSRSLAVMCPAWFAVGQDRGPPWVPRIGTSTDPRARDPRLLQASPDPSVQPTTPLLSFPRKRPLGGSA